MFTHHAPPNPSVPSPQGGSLTDRGVSCGQRRCICSSIHPCPSFHPSNSQVCPSAHRGCICPIRGVSPPLLGEFFLSRCSSAFENVSRLDSIRTSASAHLHVHVRHTFACDRNDHARETCLQLQWSAVVWKDDTTKANVGMRLAQVWIHG